MGNDELPPSAMEEHDLPVDIFASNEDLYFSAVPHEQAATCKTVPSLSSKHQVSLKKPEGVFWDSVSDDMMQEIGALKHLKAMGSSELTMLRNRHSYVRNAREASIDKETELAPNREYDLFLRENGMYVPRKEYIDIVEEAVERFSDANVLKSVEKKPSRGKNQKKGGSKDNLTAGSGIPFSSSCGSLPRP